MGARSIPPWHLWGNTTQITLQTTIGTNNAFNTNQLAKVHYRRPETWRFVFSATWLNADPTLLAAAALTIEVFFDLIIGVGRSHISIPAFETYNWQLALGDTPGPQSIRYSTSVNAPPRVTTSPANTAQNIIDHFSAEDIQLQTRMQALVSSGSGNVVVETSASFTPEVHIRPGWYEDPPNYQGDEQGV